MADDYGYKALGEFEPAYMAARRRLSGEQARQRSALGQQVASSGMRTSGMRYIPQETLERGQAEAEAGLIGKFAGAQAEAAERRGEMERQFELESALDIRRREAQEAMQRRLANQQMIGQIIGGAVGATGSVLSGGFAKGGRWA